LAEERLPACLACHGAAGTSDTPGIPSLGGQLSDYVLIQLYLFREKQRVAEPMNAMAEGLTDDDLRSLGDAMAKLPAPSAAAAALDAAGLEHGRGLVAKYRCGSCHSPDFAGHDNIPRLAAQRPCSLRPGHERGRARGERGGHSGYREVYRQLPVAWLDVGARNRSGIHLQAGPISARIS